MFQKAKEFYEIKVLRTLTAIVDKLKEAWGFVKGKFEQFVAPLKQIIDNIKEDLQNFNWNNTDEKIVRDSHYFSAYRETLIIRHHIPGCSSMSLGVIFLNTDENRQDTVPHEYGHTVQLDELGLLRYIVYIAIPSVKGYANNVQDYYSQPWERTADYYGGVNRNSYAPDSLQAAQDYLEYAKKPLYEKVADAAKKLWEKFSQKKAGTAGGTP